MPPLVLKLFQNSVHTPNNECNQAKSSIDMQVSVIPNHQPSVVVHPPEATLNDPTPAVPLSDTDRSAATGFTTASPVIGGNGGLDPALAQPISKRTAVISFVGDQLLGSRSGAPPFLRYPNRFQGGLRQSNFMMLGTVKIQTDRHSLAI